MKKRVFLVGALALAMIWLALPRPELLGTASFSQVSYDRNGRLLRLTLAEDDRYRLPVSLNEVSPHLIDATLYHEDQYFWAHPGVNPIALVRAAFETYFGGGRRVGGSTLTMQLARLRFEIHSRSIGGKLEQIFRALQLERHYSKVEILEAYLELAPYGGNVEGVGAASLIYFGKAPSELSLDEALVLAVVPQSPARRMPENNSSELRDARDRLLARWVEDHSLSDAQRVALELPLDFDRREDLPFLAPHFTDVLLRRQPERPRIFSTIDSALQGELEGLLQSYIEDRKNRGLRNASALLVDYRSMEVRALIGSADFFSDELQGQVDGTAAKRSPGSTLKPFVYALAMDEGLIHPYTMLSDAPQSFGEFNPENFDRDFRGPIHAVDALVHSRNVPAVALASKLSGQGLYGLLEAGHVSKLRGREFYGLATVLGGLELSMRELVELYAMLGNGGVMQPLRFVRDDPEAQPTRLLSAEASLLTLQMLETNARPAGAMSSRWLAPQLPAAWKTGTSHGFRDAWAVGLFGPYVLAVWVGNFDGHGDPVLVGRQAAAPLFFEMIDALRHNEGIYEHHYEARRSQLNLVETEVCELSGRLPSESCEHRRSAWFIPGQSPIDRCDIHRSIQVETATGLRACAARNRPNRSEVHEFWSSDLRRLFARAGMPRRPPPPFHPECSLENAASFGVAPRIMSPKPDLVYHLRSSSTASSQIGLSAVTDGDVEQLFWFLDGKLLGNSSSTDPLYWNAQPGQFTLLAVDDHGRSDSRQVRVTFMD